MQRLYPQYPPFAQGLTAAEIYDRLDWAPHADRPFVALNMVMSVDGRATVNGSAATLGSAADHTVMTGLRAHADALLHGAGTIRADKIGKGVPAEWTPLRVRRGLTPQPLLALLSASGDVPLERAIFAAPERVVVFIAERTPPAAVERLRPYARVIIAGDERPDIGEAVRLLGRDFGVRHVLCEGGPTLNYSLLTAAVLDELFVTVAPKLVAGDGLPMVAGALLPAAVTLELRDIYELESELFLRYRVRRPA